jgi:ASC-1-like (ASCH) protein
MEPQKRPIERRVHPRYYPERKNQPKVNFIFSEEDRIAIEVLNISKGGLFGYTSGTTQFIRFGHPRINMIEISFPEKLPFRCSGKLLRVQPTREQNKCFCAIELDRIGTDEKRAQINVGSEIERAHRPRKKILVHEQKFVDRLKKADNYFHIKDRALSAIVRRKVYDSFDDVTVKLTLEEKWCFYEIIDEMKRIAPEYPDNLKNAFLNLCRTGLKQSLDKYHEFIFSISDKKF